MQHDPATYARGHGDEDHILTATGPAAILAPGRGLRVVERDGRYAKQGGQTLNQWCARGMASVRGLSADQVPSCTTPVTAAPTVS